LKFRRFWGPFPPEFCFGRFFCGNFPRRDIWAVSCCSAVAFCAPGDSTLFPEDFLLVEATLFPRWCAPVGRVPFFPWPRFSQNQFFLLALLSLTTFFVERKSSRSGDGPGSGVARDVYTLSMVLQTARAFCPFRCLFFPRALAELSRRAPPLELDLQQDPLLDTTHFGLIVSF